MERKFFGLNLNGKRHFLVSYLGSWRCTQVKVMIVALGLIMSLDNNKYFQFLFVRNKYMLGIYFKIQKKIQLI
jgi:hypothetical protein